VCQGWWNTLLRTSFVSSSKKQSNRFRTTEAHSANSYCWFLSHPIYPLLHLHVITVDRKITLPMNGSPTTSLQSCTFLWDTFQPDRIKLNRLLHCLNEFFELSCESLTICTHPRVLIGSHSHELRLWKDEGVKWTLSQTVRAVILGRDDMNTRLILVHGIQNNLQFVKTRLDVR